MKQDTSAPRATKGKWETPELVDLASALEVIQGNEDCCLDGVKGGYKGDKDAYTDGRDLLDDII